MAEVKKATFDTSTQEGKVKVFNAMNSTSESLKNVEHGHVIQVTDVLIYRDIVDSYGAETESDVVVLFAKDDELGTRLYGSVSKTVSDSADNPIDFISDTGLEEVGVKPITQQSNNGRDFISLQMVM